MRNVSLLTPEEMQPANQNEKCVKAEVDLWDKYNISTVVIP